jgi:leader peptidase (prepilin peptidase)/N-methyltransferase
MEVFFIVIFTLLGMAVASFLNVCCDRLPVGESLIYPPSHCPLCQRRLRAKDLIPVFSYLWLRGRCRYCWAPIPRRVLWVEIGTGLLFGYLYWHYMVWHQGSGVELAVAAFYCCLFIVLMVVDLEHGLILNKVVYPALVVALIISVFLPPSRLAFFNSPLPQAGIIQAAIGGGIGFALFLLVALIFSGGMGWGDVKMAALVGMVSGYLVLVALLLAVIVGGLAAGFLLAFKIRKRKEAIPFAPFLSLATMATLLWGSDIIRWYLVLFWGVG